MRGTDAESAVHACRAAMASVGWTSRRVVVADTFLKRLRGMIGRRFQDIGDDVWLFPRCTSVHTFLMGDALDIVFADRDGRVLLALEGVPPCRVVGCRGAAYALERLSCSRSA